jgi:KipI family sensor histidine kinase inhibitor
LVAVAQRLRQTGRYAEVVPAWGNLTVVFDPLALQPEAVLAELAAVWADAPAKRAPARERVLRVRYGGEHGPDLAAVAAHAGLTEAEVIAAHAGAVYSVAFVGFQPGFAYLSGLPPALHMPRRGRAAYPRAGWFRGHWRRANWRVSGQQPRRLAADWARRAVFVRPCR